MLFGVQMFPTDYSIQPAEFARAAEEREFESVFFPEHTHIPSGRETPWPSGEELPQEYAHCLSPVVAMASAATATARIRIGTAICLVAQHDPIMLAKEIASIDLISGGRVMLGAGAGWNREEMLNHGVDPTTRMARMREHVEAMTAVWTEEEASYHGLFVDFAAIWSWPKPVQRPRPPVLIGGGGPGVLDRVLEYGDGWMPFRDGTDDWSSPAFASTAPEPFEEELSARIAELQKKAAGQGRAPVPVTLFNAKAQPEALHRYAGAGITRCIFWLPSLPAQELLPRLDRLAELARG
ncbi:LLM class F420-dependent oxidoreductase [Streptomyces spiralis]|uniref:LLM class F420-dependent oxidoreductase n=1 Tax=Streptomyces spiralis TaxID=66376 RepID=UPI0034091560